MPPDDDTHNRAGRSSASANSARIPLTTTAQSATQPKRSIFSLPAPVKRVFDKFPLREYEREQLPERARRVVQGGRERAGGENRGNVLHVFASEEDARLGRPSWNPGCLKWQTYLRFHAVDFSLIPSNNHASPSGSLPFLQPGAPPTTGSPTPDPIPANKLPKWLAKHHQSNQTPEEPNDPRLEAYQSLIDTRVRKAWLWQLYLTPQNDPLMQELYVTPCSSNPLVRYTLTRQLRSAASAELVKSSNSNTVDAEIVLREAEDAFEALNMLLGEEDEWFWGMERPGLFDAGVFAYTQLLLDEEGLGWRFNPVGEGVRRWGNLVRHRERVVGRYFGGGDDDGHGDGEQGEDVRAEVGGESGRPGLHTRTTSTLGKRKTLRG
ncbi:putative thioredoxin-like, metaxin, glutathione S-transferase domain-containing protein [Septoria linicola]|nr:putative thioredoxin-like, metaxin, glutathione S-transferase domain-containing protein [Septoria linicola]